MKKYSRGAAGGDLIFFIFFLIVLGIIWSLTGGPDRAISHAGPFLNPPFPLGNGSAYNVPGVGVPGVGGSADSGSNDTSSSGSGSSLFSNIISNIRNGGSSGEKATSPYASMVTLSIGQARANTPDSEYVTLKTNQNVSGRITISDWRIESGVSLVGTTLGDATYLPYSGQVNTESPVAIGPNTTVYLVTGRSPIGASFRSNLCVGYFEQFQDFYPRIRNNCPQPEDELRRVTGVDFIPNNSCIDYVQNLSRCTLVSNSIPIEVGNACQNFIQKDLTYSGCVTAHKNDASFYSDEWYLYLDRNSELWAQSRDSIRLLDENGLLIASVNY